MTDKEIPGINPQKFEIILNREWQEGKVQFIAGFDDYKKVECLNFYHKIRKFLGLKYKIKDRNINCTIFKVTDGAVEYITNRDEN